MYALNSPLEGLPDRGDYVSLAQPPQEVIEGVCLGSCRDTKNAVIRYWHTGFQEFSLIRNAHLTLASSSPSRLQDYLSHLIEAFTIQCKSKDAFRAGIASRAVFNLQQVQERNQKGESLIEKTFLQQPGTGFYILEGLYQHSRNTHYAPVNTTDSQPEEQLGKRLKQFRDDGIDNILPPKDTSSDSQPLLDIRAIELTEDVLERFDLTTVRNIDEYL